MNQEESLQKMDPPQDLSQRYDSSHVQAIEHYLAQGGEGVQLSEYQQKILERLRFADECIRQNQGRFKRHEIANKIAQRFDVTRVTAFKDIVNAEHVFSSSYPLNKRFEIGCRIEFLKEQIREAANNNDLEAVARLEKVLQGYYDIYPDITPTRSKKNIIVNVIQNHLSTGAQKEMSIEDALVIAQKDDSEK